MWGAFSFGGGTWAGVYDLPTKITEQRLLLLSAVTCVNDIETKILQVIINTTTRYRSVLLRFSLLWSLLCLSGKIFPQIASHVIAVHISETKCGHITYHDYST